MKSPKRNIQFLERAEVEGLINSIPKRGYRNLRDRALMTVLFSTGLRIHEALELQRADFEGIDPKQTKELTIVGKGGYQRVIFFSTPALQAIVAWQKKQKPDETRLFPLSIRGAQLMVKRRAERAGIVDRVTPHMFRHSLATDLLRQGVDVRVVQEFLGHRSISSTMVYTHVTSKDLKDIHTKLYQ